MDVQTKLKIGLVLMERSNELMLQARLMQDSWSPKQIEPMIADAEKITNLCRALFDLEPITIPRESECVAFLERCYRIPDD